MKNTSGYSSILVLMLSLTTAAHTQLQTQGDSVDIIEEEVEELCVNLILLDGEAPWIRDICGECEGDEEDIRCQEIDLSPDPELYQPLFITRD